MSPFLSALLRAATQIPLTPGLRPEFLPAWLLSDVNLCVPPESDFLSSDSIRFRKLPLYPSF